MVTLRRLATLLLATFWLQAAPPRVVRVAVFPHRPATFLAEDGRVRGLFVDMIEAAGRSRGWEVQYVQGTFAESLERLRSGEADLATSVALTQERAVFLDYGKEAAFTVWSVLYAHPGTPVESIFDVRGRVVAVMKSDLNGQHFLDLCRKFEIPVKVLELPSFEDVLGAVSSGAADVGVTTNLFGYASEERYRVVRTPVVFNPFPVYFATPKGRNADLLLALDAFLAAGRGDPRSDYVAAVDRWLHPGGTSSRLPSLVPRAAVALALLLVLSFGTILLFRHRVRRATAEVRELNRSLEAELVERRRQEAMILEIASGVSAATGDTFFQELVRHLAQATGADAAFIGETFGKDGEEWARTLAVFLDGRPAAGFEYPQTGSPCQTVYRGQPCVIPDGAQARFPGFALFRELGISSYVGCPLVNAAGQPRGLIAVLKRTPEAHPEETSTLLRIFSSRTSAELGRRAAEQERQTMERQMQHVQKLESLGVLAGGIAHDFNNLLTAMLGHLNLAQSRLSPESPAVPALDSLEQIIHRTSDLTRQLLAYSGKGRFVVQDHDLNQVIREMTHLLQVSLPKKVALQLNLAATVAPITADAAQIQQVVLNLVTNAADAIGDRDGTIRIGTSRAQLDRDYLGHVFRGQELEPGSYVVLEVHDNGCGMSPDVQARIFDPFFTTKPTGHGLGLSATLGILRGHRAGLKIWSEQGRGSTFKVLFPSAEEVPEAPREAGAPSVSLQGLRVLLVDDEAVLREATSEVLESLGAEVQVAQDGQEAVDRVARSRASIDLVFMDLTMPRMDGRQAFERIRALAPDLPIVLTSGYNEQESVQDFIGRGLAGFVQKPYTRKGLQEVLQRSARARRGPVD